MTRPRLWPTLVVLAGIVPVYVLFSGVVLVGFGVANGIAMDEIVDWSSEVMLTPIGFLMAIVPGELLLFSIAAGLAVASPTSFRPRLALTRPRLSPATWLWLVLGGIGLQFGLLVVFEKMFPEPSEHFETLNDLVASPTGGFAILVVLGLSLLPGLCEELIFRGYVQTRLVQRMPWVLAITISASVFAALHIDPQHVAVAFPLGLWFGLIAWASGSIWPAIFAHAFNNFLGVMWVRTFSGETTPTWLMLLLVLTGAAGLHLIVVGRRRQARGMSTPRSDAQRSAIS